MRHMEHMRSGEREAPVWLSPRTAAERLDTSATTIHRLIDSGRLPASRLGHLVRVRATDVDALVESAVR